MSLMLRLPIWLSRPHPRVLAIVLIASVSSGCAAVTPPVVVTVRSDVGCKAFKRLTWSPDDTTLTIDGIRRHNGRFNRLCRRPGKT